jgi:hypothetical protein
VIGSGRSALGSIKASAASPLNTPAVHVLTAAKFSGNPSNESKPMKRNGSADFDSPLTKFGKGVAKRRTGVGPRRRTDGAARERGHMDRLDYQAPVL